MEGKNLRGDITWGVFSIVSQWDITWGVKASQWDIMWVVGIIVIFVH